jgi:hypothetical protein
MRLIIAALITIAVLWFLDAEFYNGRYAGAARSMISSISGGRI